MFKKIGKILVSVFLIYIIVIYILPTIVGQLYFLISKPQSEYPRLYVSPIERKLGTHDIEKYQTQAFEDLRFKIPYEKNIKEKSSKEGLVKTFDFDEQKKIVALGGISPISAFSEYKNDNKFYYLAVQGINSNLGFYETLANTKVNQLTVFENRKTFVSKFINLILKDGTFFAQGEVYNFYYTDTPNITAFQYGTRDTKSVPVAVISKKNDKDYMFLFSKNISQQEIDLFLYSIRQEN
jgi:hypothetical protein